MKDLETWNRNYAKKTLWAFLDGKKNLNWLIGTIRYSRVRGKRLAEIFESSKSYGNPSRYQEALSACRKQGWIE
jgi:hypothetical protein